MSRQRAAWACLPLALLLTACSTNEPDDSPDAEPGGSDDPYYEDAIVEVILPSAAGGGADAQLQALIPFLEKHIEGGPQFNVSYIEGAGGVLAGNEFALRSEPGMSALFTTFSNRMAWALGEDAVEYDLGEMPIMAAMPIGATFLARTDSGVTSVADMLDAPGELYYGGAAPTGQGAMHLLALEVLGVRDDVNIIWGYEDRVLALESGELNTEGMSDPQFLQTEENLREQHGVVPLVTYGYFGEDGDLENLLFEGVPTVAEAHELLYGEPPTGIEWDAFRAVYGIINAGSTLVLHPDAPAEAVDAFRAGAIAAAEDPEFLAAQEAIGLPVPAKAGDDLRPTEELMFEVDHGVLEWVVEWLHENYPDEME